MADEFFYKADPGAPEQGPIDAKSLKQLAALGELSPESLLRRGSGDWVAASSVKGLEFAPAEEIAYPEAIPVAAPSDNVPEALPAGLASLNVGGKKRGPAPPVAKMVVGKEPLPAKPALDLPQGLTTARGGGLKTPMAVPVDSPKAAPMGTVPNGKPAAKTWTTVPPEGDDTAPAAATAPPLAAPNAANPFATEPSPRQPRPRKSGGGLGSLFSFDSMIGPTVIKTLFYLGVVVIFFWWAGFTAITLVWALASSDSGAVVGAVIGSAIMLIPAIFYVVLVRVLTEMVIVFFQIHDDVRDIRDHLDARED